MKNKKSLQRQLERKLQHDENLILKILSEVGDLCRFMRQMEARIEKLERRIK